MTIESGTENKSVALRLFVWEDALRDYTAGLAVVLAHDEAEAREIMLRDFPEYVAERLPFIQCKIHSAPIGFYVYGGG